MHASTLKHAPEPARNGWENVSTIDEVLEANRRFADVFDRPGEPRPPSRGLVVIACMDTRVHPYELLGLQAGEAHVIRNAGGIVTEDVLRSLVISRHVSGTREVMIISNTKCGMTTFRDDELLARVERETGTPAVAPACFHAFTDPAENARRQVLKVRAHPWIPDDVIVRGFVYDVDTGRLTEVGG